MSRNRSQLRIASELLFVIVLFSAARCYGQTLQEKLAQQTDFSPRSDTPADQLIEVAQEFKIPVAIEWVEQQDQSENPTLGFGGGTVLDLITAITQQSPDCIVTKEGEMLHAFSQTAVSNPLNFLNLRIPEYRVFNEPLYIAEGLLRTRINMVLYPDPYSGGIGGGYGGGMPNPFLGRSITFSGFDLTIREILIYIAEALGNALWIVRLNPDELTGTRPKWEGVPRNKSGHSPINYRWQFIPLDK